jgi:glutaconate CoA-transferase subunit B
MEQENDYSPVELMACAASRILEDGKSVFVGTGLPIIASALAQKTHAPHLFVVFEAGSMGAQIPELPISVGGSRTLHKAIMTNSMDYVMSVGQLGYLDYAFLGGAQIDMYGNINTTVIGPHDHPKTRLPGSGGGNDGGSLCWRIIIMMQQDARRFVKKLDFLTTPGYLTGPGARERAGLPADTGPYRVITQLGVMDFDEKTKRMALISLHPGITLDQVKSNTGFDLLIPNEVAVTQPPSEEELRILRTEIDPARILVRR